MSGTLATRVVVFVEAFVCSLCQPAHQPESVAYWCEIVLDCIVTTSTAEKRIEVQPIIAIQNQALAILLNDRSTSLIAPKATSVALRVLVCPGVPLASASGRIALPSPSSLQDYVS